MPALSEADLLRFLSSVDASLLIFTTMAPGPWCTAATPGTVIPDLELNDGMKTIKQQKQTAEGGVSDKLVRAAGSLFSNRSLEKDGGVRFPSPPLPVNNTTT